MSALTPAEAGELARLINKLVLPAPLPVFEAWCRVFGTLVVEVVLLRDGFNGTEIFLIQRPPDDHFFQGWHIPGCVHLPTETVDAALERLVADEIAMIITKPEFLDWFERVHGTGPGQLPRGHELSLVFTAKLTGPAIETDTVKFFPLRAMPSDLISNQGPIIKQLTQKYGQN